MKHKYILYSLFAAASLSVASCDYNEDHFPGFDELAKPTDIGNDTLTLAATDYKTIAGLQANKNLATSKDPEGETYKKALEAVGTNGYFTEMAPAVWYLPAYIEQQFPYYDNGSKVTIYYDEYENLPDYLNDFNGIKSYALTSDDYKTVWGDRVTANYLSPSTLREIPSILSAANPDATEGDMLLVNYAYSDTEPSIGGDGGGEEPAEPVWTELTSIPVRSAGQNWNFVNVGPVDLSEFKGQTINVAFRYTSTTSGGPTWELRNFHALAVPYLDVYLFAEQSDGSFKKLATEGDFAGAGNYVIASLGADGNYYPFGRLDGDSYNYGYMHPSPITVTDGVISAADAAYSVVTVEATAVGYSLKNAIGKYLYMSGNYDSFNVADAIGESGFDWTIETAGGADLFTITNVEKGKSVKLNYFVDADDGSASYSFGSYAADKIDENVYFSNSLADGGGFTTYDVNLGGLSYVWGLDDRYSCWKASGYVSGVNHETDSYIVSPAIEIDADATLPYFTIDEAFRYGSVDQITMYVVTGYDAASTASLAANTRAAVTPNTSAVYRFNGSTWVTYSTDAAEIAVLQPSDYDQIGYSTIRYPEETLPIYLKQAYPYAGADDVVAVVYTNGDGAITATEFIYDGANWVVTTVAQRTSIVFLKTDGEWLEAKVYYSSTLLDGESGGFTTQDIALDGLTYVWSLDNAYGWKASGYANGTNKETESWLISPEIDLGKAVAPVMKFDVAINFLSRKEVGKYFTVNISTDYSGDATTATWETLDITGWPEGNSWTFVTIENVDMSAYVGQKIYLGFHYKSDAEAAPTVEIQDLSIQE